MSPCTEFVAREFAITLPDFCWLGVSSGMRSTKLVSSRLKPIVCEFAMLPEMFSSANACARMPDTAVFRAPKIPITLSHLLWPGRTAPPDRTGTRSAIGKPERLFRYFKQLDLRHRPHAGQDTPPPAKISGRK